MGPAIVRVHVYMPGGRGRHSRHAAVAHARYVVRETREDVSRDVDLAREVGEDEAAIHARYMRGRAGASGLWGADPLAAPALADAVLQIEAARGPVWRVIVTVPGADAEALAVLDAGHDLRGRAAWERVTRQVVPAMWARMGGEPGTVRWVAAHHKANAAGAPHIHLLMWEANDGARDGARPGRRPFLDKGGLRAARQAWVGALYAPERVRLGRERDAARAEARAAAQVALRRPEADALAARLAAVAAALPGRGRQAYALLPAAARAAVDAALDEVLALPAVAEAAERYMAGARAMAAQYTTRGADLAEAAERAGEDLRRRLAAVVIRAAVEAEQGAAWAEITAAVREAMRPVAAAGAEAVRREVAALAAQPAGARKAAAVEAARRLLNGALTADVGVLTAGAGEHGRVRERVVAAVADRLERSATYERDRRAWEAQRTARGVGAALDAATRRWQAEAERAAEALDEEAEREALAAARAGA